MKSITKKLLSGLLLCAILCSALAFPIAADTTCSHALENGACKHCKEVAKKVTVAEGITLYAAGNKLLEPTDGVYYLFENDVVILKRGRVPSGMYFDSWKITSNANDYTLSGNQLCIGSADLAIEATFSANQKVNVIVNSPLFYVTGLSSMQFGAASISPVAGTSISVSYAGKMFMPNSKVVYWINENGMIVGMGDEITMTVSTPTTITAICDQGTAGSSLVVYRNGADRVGTKVISYLSVVEADIENLTLHANASVGTLTVIGWKVAGGEEVLTNESYRAAVRAAIESGESLYLEPMIAKTTVDVAINVGEVGSNEYDLGRVDTVYASEYVYISAPVINGKYFSHWNVNGEVIASDTLIYKFEKQASYTVIAYYTTTPTTTEAEPAVRLDADAPTGGGKIYLNGIYQIPEGYTLTDAGILYTTDEALGSTTDFKIGDDGVKVRKASGLEGKENATYNLTLSTSKEEITIWARAFMTYIDADSRIVTVYTDIENIYYTTKTSEAEPAPEALMLPEQEVRVVGINIYAGQNNLDVRGELLADMLNPLELDSFGVSECKGGWETKLDELFGDRYARVGVDCTGKHNATSFATYIYYRKDKYIAIDTGTFWMSQTPDTPSKYGATVDMNRTCTWVLLENIETGFRYVHMNCHLDHMDVDVNKIQCQMIGSQIKRFEQMGYPVFATGDYNMREYNESYPTITSYATDARYVAKSTTDMLTHPESGTIDYCFITQSTTEVLEFDVLDTQFEPIEISDHRGVYVRAIVRSLPRQELYAATPEFAEDAEIEVNVTGSASCIITVDQARDAFGSVPRFYLIESYDRNGKLLTSEKISSGYHLAVQPETILYTFNFPTANEIYRVRIVPLGLFGQSGVPMLEWIDCTVELPSQPTTPVAPEGKADIVDVKVVDGEIKNVSDSALTFERLGDATVANNSFSFIQNGNLKFDGFKNYYSTLANGFAATAVFTTGSDISTQQDIFGNKHAGGFGLSVQSGKLSFSVHLNGAYVSATVQVKANTTYHIVGVYDPTVGVILYVNGEMAAIAGAPSNATFGLPTVAGAQYLCIGADSNATGSGESFFKGSITSVAIYSAPLTYENALYLYQNK